MLSLLNEREDDSAERAECFRDPVGLGKLLGWKACLTPRVKGHGGRRISEVTRVIEDIIFPGSTIQA